MSTRRFIYPLLATLGLGALAGQAATLAGSGDPFTLEFDPNGNGLLDLRGGLGLQVEQGALEPDPTQAGGPLVLTYLLPTEPLAAANGDVRVWSDATETSLIGVLRFTDAAGGLTGQSADRMIFYEPAEPGNPQAGLANTGLPVSLTPDDGGGIVEVNDAFEWAPGGALNNVFDGVTVTPEPAPAALLCLGGALLAVVRWRKR